MSTVVIQCPRCSQKYQLPPDKLGTQVQCQQPHCKFPFIAEDINRASIPEEFDESIPVEKPRAATNSEPVTSHAAVSRQTEMRLEGQRLAREMTQESARDTSTGRLLFWGGLLLLLVAALLDTSVKTEATAFTSGRVHNMGKAANQLMLALCGLTATISGAALMSTAAFHLVERILLIVWFGVVVFVLAVPIWLG